MDNNRPRSREKRVVDGGKDIHKKGTGLGTGPVGSGSGGGKPSGGGSAPLKSGVGKLSMIIIVILIILGSMLFGGSDDDSSGNVQQAQTAQNDNTDEDLFDTDSDRDDGGYEFEENSNTEAADTAVADGARDKYTVLKGDGSDTVTIMMYLCGTDLESKYGMATNDLTEMTKANISDKINLIVYTGGCKKWKNNIVSSKTNQIYRVRSGQLERLEADLGAEAMTDPKTLTGFINYCTKNYPADRNELILWDHGGGSISGFGYDEKNMFSDSMTLAGINTALKNAGVKFDFIGFDACLMATVENALMLEQYGDYMIASEETEPGVGWYYTNWLSELSKNTAKPTVEVGKRIVDDFVDVCSRECPGQKTTLSVVDLAELKATVPTELTNFARSTNELIKNKEYKLVSDARYNTREFAQSLKIDQVDLVHFSKNMGTNEGNALARVIEGAVKYNRTASYINNANGLSIYFPYKKAGNVKDAIATYKLIGMNEEYGRCIQEFAGLEASGQIAAGGDSSPLSSLFESFVGGDTQEASGGDADIIFNMLGSLLSGYDGRALDNRAAAEYISENYFDAQALVWKKGADGRYIIELPGDQWDLIKECDLNVFFDDGEGYIDLGLDNVFELDEDGNLIGDYDNTWLAIDKQPVAYYHLDTVEDGDDYTITGYVPALLNGDRVKLILVFDNDDPYGYIAGAESVYRNGETDTAAKNLTEVGAGDKVQFICDFYSYDGEYQDSYMLGDEITLTDDTEIANVDIGRNKVKVMYRLTDIYQQNYWTPKLP